MTPSTRLAWMRHLEETGDAAAVCARFAISRPTLRKWWRRYRDLGEAGLAEPSRRPASSPHRKVFAAEEALILRLRRERGLGLHRLRTELATAHALDISADTILKVLRRAGEPVLRASSRSVAGPPAPQTPVSADGVATSLSELITSGQFRPGDKLSEAALGARLGVGRTRIREALRQLAVSGVVNLQRNRGAFVASPSLQEVEQAYAARRLIEGDIVTSVACNCTGHDLRVLKAHLARQVAAQESGGRGQLVHLLTEFHLVIASLGENRVLADILAALTAKTSLAVLLYDHPGSPSCAIAEHAELIGLIAAGDAAGAVALMRRHLTTNQARLKPPQQG